jgi:uncharacterized membrane protein
MRVTEDEPQTDVRLQLFLGRLLRIGVSIAAAVAAAAVVLRLASGNRALPDYRIFHGEPPHVRTIRGVLAGVRALEPAALMQLGLMILVATPVARVAFSVVGFALERDRLYVGLTLAVLALLLLGLAGATG